MAMSENPEFAEFKHHKKKSFQTRLHKPNLCNYLKPIYAHEQVYLKKYKMTKEIKVYKCQKSTSLVIIDNLTIPLKS